MEFVQIMCNDFFLLRDVREVNLEEFFIVNLQLAVIYRRRVLMAMLQKAEDVPSNVMELLAVRIIHSRLNEP